MSSEAAHPVLAGRGLHKRFIEECSMLWDRVQVYDFE